MAGPKPAWSAALVLLTACTRLAQAAEGPAAVQGFVADAQGAPISGALISVFGNELRGGLITHSDQQGRFMLTGLPAGSYTLRALSTGRAPAPARAFTVLPQQRAVFSVSLPAPLAEGVQVPGDAPVITEADESTLARRDTTRELRYRLRHKRRSVLETRAAEAGQETRVSLRQPTLPRPDELAGRLEFVAHTTPAALRALSREDAASYGLLRLDGRLTDSVSWSLAGLLAENESASWRMAAEFLIDAGAAHEVTVGSGYGSGLLRPALLGERQRSTEGRVGALFVRDRVRLGREWSATLGTRWTYIGFLQDNNHTQPEGSLTFARGPHRVTASATARTLTPGGDLLTLSNLGSAPALSYAVLDGDLRPERVTRYELAYAADVGALDVGAHAFREGTRDRLDNMFEPGGGRLRIVNGQGTIATGVGLSLARRWGRHVSGSVGYATGRAHRGAAPQTAPDNPLESGFERATFHDLEARLEGTLAASGTRLMLYYRVGALAADDEQARSVRTRFDVRLNQDLPFLTPLTRADWEVLLAVRNLFYEAGEGGLLDELAVQNPPTRVVGGISVRF